MKQINGLHVNPPLLYPLAIILLKFPPEHMQG